MSAFFRYPHTPHLAWLGRDTPRSDKVFTDAQQEQFLSRTLLAEEKVDGANIGISLSDDGHLRVQSRGAYLDRNHVASQFKPLFRWVDSRAHVLLTLLQKHLILFGEWCYAVHTVRYSRLPDWFLGFDVYDRAAGAFWNVERRDGWMREAQLASVPHLQEGRFTLESLKEMIGTSRLGAARGEGLYLRVLDPLPGNSRAKLVTPEFTQSIGEHWSTRVLQTNTLAEGAAWP